MPKTKFKLPIVVEPRWGRQRVISSAREAGEVLLRDWPTHECLKRRKAMAACLSAIRGDTKPSVARKAFLEAAKAAGIIPRKSQIERCPPLSRAFRRLTESKGIPVVVVL